MSFRKEKKIKLTYSEISFLQQNLLKRGMSQLYPSRNINSCYFDNRDMIFFSDSEEGVVPRKKIRIRWYNNSNKFKKETKISSIEGRFKFSQDIDKINTIADVFKSRFFDSDFGNLSPKLMVNYTRSYFKLDKLRITFDKDIFYSHISSDFNKKLKDQECVMEIKTSINCSNDYIEKIISQQETRFSKYSRGLILFQS